MPLDGVAFSVEQLETRIGLHIFQDLGDQKIQVSRDLKMGRILLHQVSQKVSTHFRMNWLKGFIHVR